MPAITVLRTRTTVAMTTLRPRMGFSLYCPMVMELTNRGDLL